MPWLLPCWAASPRLQAPYPSCHGRGYVPPWKGSSPSLSILLVGNFHCQINPRGRIRPLETGVVPRRVCCSPTAGVCCHASVERRRGQEQSSPLQQGQGPWPQHCLRSHQPQSRAPPGLCSLLLGAPICSPQWSAKTFCW